MMGRTALISCLGQSKLLRSNSAMQVAASHRAGAPSNLILNRIVFLSIDINSDIEAKQNNKAGKKTKREEL